jgi:F-type H+-transporting ATPase subunit delta
MVSTIIASRYAKAFLESALAEGAEDRIAGEASALAEALGDDRDVRRFLTEPLSSAADKLGVLLSSFPEPPHPLMKSFLMTVMENKRERFLPLMLKEFLRLMRDSRGEVSAELTTAYQLAPAQRQLIERELSGRLKRKVELIPMVDRQILGGATLRVGDTVYDGSLKNSLRLLEASLAKEPLAKAPRAAAKPAPGKAKAKGGAKAKSTTKLKAKSKPKPADKAKAAPAKNAGAGAKKKK